MAAIFRDRAIVVASLVAIAALAWAYLFSLSQDMSGMEDMPGMAMSSGPAPFSLTATMWAVMMVGMMLPSALPMILLFTMVHLPSSCDYLGPASPTKCAKSSGAEFLKSKRAIASRT